MKNDNQINKERLRAELSTLESRIQAKIIHLCLSNKKLPFERLSKGRQLKDSIRQTIQYLDQGEFEKVELYLKELSSQGLIIKTPFN
ncbi:hypothetical protein [Belliella pelovolcani]|uniref:Uncharacterized protein n=1 Tax=Belliella pelovolcani TaxID=529505 RepID=A0A1N7PS88_9BACT|nr:hypothetical protein [Belliella pelovolcani]SIT13426.1 hypothetical protein SAMN05421761_1205 [Belliella pelovolcani]